jgi:GntR family transcriptional regulator/MocR family aminotransferase
MLAMLRFTGADTSATFRVVDGTSHSVELLLSVDRDGPHTLGAQIEEQLRGAIRTGALRPGAQVPSTRDLARQLGISRRVAVEAYSQLAAEGYLSLRQGARPRVSETAAVAPNEPQPAPRAAAPRFDFRPSVPDVSAFPRTAWLRSLREALSTLTDAELGYGDPAGDPPLREALADYLGRVRGVVADPGRVVVTSGYGQAQGLICQALAKRGAKRIALEDPCNPEQHAIALRAGLTPVKVPVDEHGIKVAELPKVDAVIVTPAHQHPTGVVLAAERRTALLQWLRDHDAIAIEDDYDAEYRYDRAAVGALQGLEPERIVYAGSASKTLAPALRLGWLVVPADYLEPIRREKHLADQGTARIEQRAFADFIARGELDRHLRRMRSRYRARRDALVEALAHELPEASIKGIAAGLHVTVELPAGSDDRAIKAAAQERRIVFNTMSDYSETRTPTLMLGYGQLPEPAIRAGVRELAEIVRAVRAECRGGPGPSGLPISQWWPNGSATRPSRQPCSSAAG